MSKYYISLYITLLLFSCGDFIDVDTPRNELVRSSVFVDDKTAEAAVIDLYYSLRLSGFSNGNITSISFIGAIASDEVIHHLSSSKAEFDQLNTNTLAASNAVVNTLWTNLYSFLYRANAVIEGLERSSGVSERVKLQLSGEALFFRAFCHFYLVNFWGDVPLVTSTSYDVNKSMQRTDKELVYQQIVADLLEAQRRLSEPYPTAERVRVNRAVTTALLARVYLYQADWVNAAVHATTVIEDDRYMLEPDLSRVFRRDSREAIFQIWSDVYPIEINTFAVFGSVPTSSTLNPTLVESFEADDQRWATWGRFSTGDTPYPFVVKYLEFSNPPTEFSMVFRLAEQYLIRAEAQLNIGEAAGALSDINTIRTRAGLEHLEMAGADALKRAIEQERRHELFTEWGHRWLDLKRTGRAGEVLAPTKGNWTDEDLLFPIPESQLRLNPLRQNPGY